MTKNQKKPVKNKQTNQPQSKELSGQATKPAKEVTKPPFTQYFALIVAVACLFLVIDLGRRMATNYRVQREAEMLTEQVTLAKQHQAELLARRSYVASDLFIEEVARTELKWTKPGETIIVILPTPEAALSANGHETATKGEPLSEIPPESWSENLFGKAE